MAESTSKTDVIDDEVLNFHLKYSYLPPGEFRTQENASVKGTICSIDVDQLTVVVRSTITTKEVEIVVDRENYGGGVGHLGGLFRILCVGDGMCARGRPAVRADGVGCLKAVATLIEKNNTDGEVNDETYVAVNHLEVGGTDEATDPIVGFCMAHAHHAPGTTCTDKTVEFTGIATDVDTERGVILLRSFKTTVAVEVTVSMDNTELHGAKLDDIEPNDRITVSGTPGRAADGTYSLVACSVQIDFTARPVVEHEAEGEI